MKKLVAVILCAALLAVPVSAEEKPLEDRVAELEQKIEALEKELAELKGEGTSEPAAAPTEGVELISGFYTVGEDLPAGTYTLSASHGTGFVYIYKTREDHEESEYRFLYNFHLVSQEFLDSLTDDRLRGNYENSCDMVVNNLKLDDGMFIVVDEVTALFTPKE